MSAFYISAAHKSSGKTTLSIGLCAALSADGDKVQSFKKGPDYIDPLWLSQASNRPCYNLDFNVQSHAEIEQLFHTRSRLADQVLVEGNKGLYDGMDLLGSDSNAALAELLGLPVLLVLDVQGITRGVAPLLLGYQQFGPHIGISGVLLNKVAGARHETKLRRAIEHYTDIPVLGAVHRRQELIIKERHLGLVPSNEEGSARILIERLADAVRQQTDLERIRALGVDTASEGRAAEASVAVAPDVTLAVARDAAFGFYYPDDLEVLQRAGARLLFFSPLQDETIPSADGLFIGGGFPETHMEILAANRPMLESIRDFIERDGPVYAECGGLMYLCRSLHWQGKVSRMVAAIGADAVMYQRPQGRGYVRMAKSADHPWPGGGEGELPLHEFHYSRLENMRPGYRFGFRLSRGKGIDGQRDGLIYRNLLAGYAHQRHVACNPWAEDFVAFIRQCKAGGMPYTATADNQLGDNDV